MHGFWLVAFLVQWIIVISLTLLVGGILRYLSAIQERLNLTVPPVTRYDIHQKIDDFELFDSVHKQIKSTDMLNSSGTVILFVSITCQSCIVLLDQISELVSRHKADIAKMLLVIALGDEDDFKRLISMYPATTNSRVIILADEKGTVSHLFGITSLPIGLIVDQKGRVLSQTLNPHAAHWLYKAIDAPPPIEPLSQTVTGLVVPAAHIEQS